MLKGKDNTLWLGIAHFVMLFMTVCALLPFLLLVIASFTENQWATANGFTFFPEKWSLDAYRYIAAQWDTIGRAYLMTVVVTAMGTAGSILVTAGFSYALSNRNLPGVRLLSFLCIFTMLFNGGIVATYYSWVNIFGIRDTIWALVFPNLFMSAFNVILFRNYIVNNIPESLLEAVRIDGAGEFRVFWQIVMPLSVPILATIGLMTGIAYWNDWINGLYYLTERGGRNLFTIQLILNSINENITYLASNTTGAVMGAVNLPSTTMRMAIAVVGILPVLAAYPFFQRYFVRGISLGAVKG